MITKEEVQKIAKLARLGFEEEKVANFSAQLRDIMDMIDILSELDCTNVAPLASVGGDMSTRTRKDEVTAKDISGELFDNVQGSSAALAKEVKYFVTPKVIE